MATIKLLDIWNARNIVPEVNRLKKTAKLTYLVGIFIREQFSSKLAQVQSQVNEMFTELGTDVPKSPGMKEVKDDSPHRDEFHKRYGELMEQTCEIALIDATFAKLIDSLGEEKVNGDVFLLEPFFKPEEKPKTESDQPAK